ncbi:hypothetical protein HGB13_01085 [bacterium]|nr:hypothetical protein [bacterium]
MNTIKKIYTATLVLATSPISAKINGPVTPPGVPTDSLSDLIGKISNAILSIVAVLAILFLILAGFQYVTSAGNPDQITKAKNTALYAIIGIIVALVAWAVVKFVVDAF